MKTHKHDAGPRRGGGGGGGGNTDKEEEGKIAREVTEMRGLLKEVLEKIKWTGSMTCS